MHQQLHDFRISTPEELQGRVSSVLGWCSKTVDSLADRLVFRGFAGDIHNMDYIFDLNNRDIFFDSAILSALIAGCCFVYIYPGNDGFPRLQVIDGGEATGILDPVTGLLTDGYAILERRNNDPNGRPTLEAYFKPGYTVYYRPNQEPRVAATYCSQPTLVPIIFRPDAYRQFGHSRISRACMELTQSAMRTIVRSEISAEFYSFPQRYALGMPIYSDDDEEDGADGMDRWKMTMSTMLMTYQKDEDDDYKPTLGQFQQQSMQPHVDHLRMFASAFAAESGLTLDDLGFVTDNPSSAEAIKASHENLRLTARKAQRCFGSNFLNVGYVAACLRDKMPYLRYDFYETKPLWEPIFEPDAAMLSGIGDGAIKLNQAVPGFFGPDNLRQLTGIEADDYGVPTNPLQENEDEWLTQ